MQRNPERLAWMVLWAAFIVFCLMVTSIPLGTRSFLLTSTLEMDTLLQRIEGTILLRKEEASEAIGVTDSATVLPGDEIILDATSRGTLDLFDRSQVFLYSNTDLEVTRVDAPRFEVSDRPNEVVLTLTGGLARVAVAPPGERETRFEVLSPHTRVALAEGSYRIEVTNQTTQVTVMRGEARLGFEAAPVVLLQGQRARVDLSGVPSEPLPAAQNLVENGDFQAPLATGWITNTVVYTTSIAPPGVEVVESGGRQAVRLYRREADQGHHTEVAIHQELDHDVHDFARLEIAFDLMINYQSLSGGGLQSSEFPVIVRLDYKDLWGNDKFWTHGFYYQNQAGYAIAHDPWGRPTGEEIPRGRWYPFESGNLLELLGDNLPVYVTGITVYASGWNYDSLVSEVQLIVE
ncbi:MAG: FecR domain-containing protein [Anaerolineae bacterium]|jgi:hypothetical protein